MPRQKQLEREIKGQVQKGHTLVIDSLHDAQAHCSCGRWFFSFTGAKTREEIREEYETHNYTPSAIFLEPDELTLDAFRQQGLVMTEEELAQRVLNIFEAKPL